MKTKLILGFILIALMFIMAFSSIAFLPSHAVTLTVTSSNFGGGVVCTGLLCQTATLSITAKNLLVVSWAWFGVSIPPNFYTDFLSITDTQGNSFLLGSSSVYGGVGNHGETMIFYTNASSTSSDTVTIASYIGGEATFYQVSGFTKTPNVTSYSGYGNLMSGINTNGISFASYSAYATGGTCSVGPSFAGAWTTTIDGCINSYASIGIAYANPSVSSLVIGNPHDYPALSIVNFATSVSNNCSYFQSIETNTFVTTNSTVISGHTFYFTGTTTNYTTHTSIGYISSTTTVITTETGIVAPNMNSLLYWFFEIVCLLVPVAFIDGWILESKNGSVDIVFGTLIGLMVGSWLGLMINISTWGVAVAFTVIFVIYLWRGRG